MATHNYESLKVINYIIIINNYTVYSHAFERCSPIGHAAVFFLAVRGVINRAGYEWLIRSRGDGLCWWCRTYERWSKSSMDTLGRTVTLFTSLWRPSNKKRRNSWASCWLQRHKLVILFYLLKSSVISEPDWVKRLTSFGGKTYLQPTNLGAYLWIWLLKSEGLMASLFTEVHRFWVSFANSEAAGEEK